MLSGREALGHIERAVSEARTETDELNARVAALNEREVAMRDEMRAELEKLARFRLSQSAAGTLSQAADGMGREVNRLMAARAGEITAIAEGESAAGQRIADLEARRVEAAGAAEQASEALDAAEAKLQDSLGADEAYCTRHEAVEQAEAVALEAEHKLGLAEEDRRTKGAPYETDTLFMYLWQRRFGTPDYDRSGIVATCDRWVARLIRYEAARRNYYMLTEIPKRVSEHAGRMRGKADGEVDALVALENAARAKTDIPSLEEALKDARGSVEAIDAEISSVRGEARQLEARRATFERGEDEQMRAVLERMVEVLDAEDLSQLRREALKTRMPEDDEIVERLVDIEDELEDLAHEREQLLALGRGKANKVEELEQMRAEFRRRRYDDYSSEFADERLFDLVLAEFARGALSGSGLWDRLDRTHRRAPRRSQADFGSGKFRFPGPLTFPGSRGSSGGSRRSGGGMGRGGFRTGGGMSRGGGFKTGGGF